MWSRVLAVLLALCAALPAHALEPFMWGIGPRIGTIAIPARYPIKFPAKIERHLDADESTLPKARHDFLFGAEGVYYLDSFSRVGMDVGIDLAAGFTDLHIAFKYNYVARAGVMDFLFGGGIGFGSQTFRGEREEKLTIPYFPLRGDVAALVRDNSRGYQLTVFLLYNIPQNHFYTRPNGDEEDVGWGFNLALGLELAVLFGDFTPPRPRGG